MAGDGENERRLLSFWARHVGFGIYPSRLDRIIPEIARRFAVMEIADERGGLSAPSHRQQVTIGALDQPISSMGFTEKVALVFQRMPAYLPETAQAELRQLLTPAAIGAAVGSVVAVILGGPIVQGILLAVGFAVAGWSIFRAIGDILDFLALTRAATTHADIDAAARKLAAAVSALGIGAIIALLSRGASRAITQGHTQRPQQATRQTQNTQQQTQNTTSQNTQTTRDNLNGGAARRAQHGANWPRGNLRSSLDRFAGSNPRTWETNTGKRIYENRETGIQVVEDIQGGYYRIFDPNLPGRRRYLDLDGNIPNNRIIDGRQIGRTQDEYNQVTHFLIE